MASPVAGPITTIVVPTVGRPSLAWLVQGLLREHPQGPVVVVDDRPPSQTQPLDLTVRPGSDVAVVRSGGRGPAHARNLGWRLARTPWVSFLDDDVAVPEGWYAALLADLREAQDRRLVGTAARVDVPLPSDRRPTDWERTTAGLAGARWITADLSYRRDALAAVGGFDERFPHAFREDSDLALRLGADRGNLAQGQRRISHPVRPADWRVSIRQQSGNSDDQLMRRLHGRDWHGRAGASRGRLPRHLLVTVAGLLGVVGLVGRRRVWAGVGWTGWLAGTAELAWARIAPGPRDPREVTRMLATSVAIPPLASWHALAGAARHARAPAWRGLPDAVLLDRDGTLIHDVPYNGDPERVRTIQGVRAALDRLRGEGVRLAVVSNQSGVNRGWLSPAQVEAVNARVSELLGPFDAVRFCPHTPADRCGCRKPAPGLLLAACANLGADPARTVMVGDVGADVAAAAAAGVSAYLVPTAQTRPEELVTPRLAGSLGEAVDRILAGEW